MPDLTERIIAILQEQSIHWDESCPECDVRIAVYVPMADVVDIVELAERIVKVVDPLAVG